MTRIASNQAPSAGHAAAFERLVKLLTVKRGFQFFILVCPDPRERDRLIDSLAATPGIAERPTLRIDLAERGSAAAPPADVNVLEDRLHTEAGANGIVHLVNGDGWLNPDRLAELNLHRNALAARVNAALLWWLPEPTVVSLAKTAPDLWSWRTAVVAFESAPATEPPTVQLDAPKPSGFLVLQQMPQETREARIAELQGLIGAVADPEQRFALVLEWIDLLVSLGQLSEALIVLRTDGLAAAANTHSEAAQALVQSRVADILTTRGELGEALRILSDEVQPAFEKLGDVRAKAVTQGKIADILMARGQLDEALRIRTEEELPVYERLGDVRAKAVTQGQIADILMARGELDEALRIRTEEQLPVYEKLGDVRELLVARAKIGINLLTRNAPGDRAEARRLFDLALADARRLKLPQETAAIESWLADLDDPA